MESNYNRRLFSSFNATRSLIRQTRQVSNNNIYIKSETSTQYRLRSIQITGPSLWNSLPANLKNCSYVATFRRKLKHYYIDNYCNSC